MGNVTVIGSSNIDLVVKSRTLPVQGETVLGGDFFQAFGGKGANQAVAAARAGAQVDFIARVGDDSFGNQMLANFEADGINGKGVAVSPGPSGVALILIDQAGENIISVAPGANNLLTPDDIIANQELIKQSDVVLVQLEVPLAAIEKAIAIANAAGVITILNPAPVPQGGIPDTLKQVTWCTPNEGELFQLSGLDQGTLEEAAQALHVKGTQGVIVTRGSSGVSIIQDGISAPIPSRKVDAVDTVGAGDCFSGCLAAALSEGLPLEEAVRFAVAGASLSVTVMGAQPSMPTREQIEAVLAQS